MKPIFHPYLVNRAHGDPVLYIDFLFDRRAILFDLGDISSISPKKLLRITDIFISHTHMDHFFGFDHLLRILLGREKHIRIFGPPGILQNVSGKLQGYTWNLVENYESNLTFEVTEVHEDHLLRNTFSCKAGFHPDHAPERIPSREFLLDTLTFQVKSVCLDHFTPCLAFCLQEKDHLNVNKVKLQEMGLPVGPWLKELKDAIRAAKPDDTLFTILLEKPGSAMLPATDKGREIKEPLSRLKSIVDVSRGQKIAYVVDSAYTESNREKTLALAKEGDCFFCEAAFLEKDRDRAAQRSHLTAHQAGLLARDARVRKLVTFHFSPRYHGSYHLLIEEAMKAFKGHF
ncbi:MAG: ribonuclease Z [bacterium]